MGTAFARAAVHKVGTCGRREEVEEGARLSVKGMGYRMQLWVEGKLGLVGCETYEVSDNGDVLAGGRGWAAAFKFEH